MKKIATLIIAIFCATAVMAQETESSPIKRHEITAGVGLLSHTQMVTFVADLMGTVLTLGYGMAPDDYNILTPNITYRYWFNNWYALGGGFAFDSNSVKINRQSDGTYMHTYQRYYYTFVLENTFGYLRKPAFQLYGQFGLGGTFVSIPNNDFDIEKVPFINFQITPVGFRIGKDFAGFMEFGYGYKGIINAGLSVRL